MWKILEDYNPEERRGMSYRGDMGEYEEGFEEGCEHGYMKAMKEMRMMGMRGGMGRGTGRMNNRYVDGAYMPPYPAFRDDDDNYEDMGERRRRDSRGRYM